MRMLIIGAISCLGFTLATPALAHHSYGMFDRTVAKAVTGTVREFQWKNPHSLMRLEVQSPNGAAVLWNLEMGPPATLARHGFTRTSVRAGDKVEVTISPLRDGTPGGHLLSLTLPNGTVLAEPNLGVTGQGSDLRAVPRPGATTK